MGLIQTSRQATGGGGGGLTINGFANDQFTQSSNFAAGTLTLTLSETPITPEAVVLDYNGARCYYGIDFTVSGATVSIVFGDPYVTDYDTPPVFQATYAY